LGYQPQRIRGSDYWYFSPFRDEKEPSFKVERNKNVWYDHGLGKGGKLIDFAMEFYHCNVNEALQKISFFHPQKSFETGVGRPQFHLHENSLLNHRDARETAIKIIAAKQPIQDLMLCRYLLQRRIDKSIADSYCHEVHFTNADKEKIYKAIGFKNNAGGYELRNEYFKGSSSPKYITYLDNGAKNISVFEGFFDFMSYQSMNKNQLDDLTGLPNRHMNFLILNSLSFFERSLLLMEKHQSIHLYLDHDNSGRKYTNLALKRSLNFKDESKLYKGYKDLNDWMMNFGKLEKQKNVRQSMRRHL
ncbi:MAG: CHC2 zinc finger domain-containing protein, partial [Bacteroidota bacterium]|nr:CHC2 zinc finger domain-containing protein [Bacteroidota bacterium]